MIWWRRLFRAKDQRFVVGETVTHKDLGTKAKVTAVTNYGGWYYNVEWSGRCMHVTDMWDDNEIL